MPLINWVDVIATAVILAGLPWVIRRLFGPVAASRRAWAARVSGYAAVVALIAVKSGVARFEHAPAAQRQFLPGSGPARLSFSWCWRHMWPGCSP